MDINKQNIILTGPPRSGTTLTCHLLNHAPQTIALHEPMRLKMFPSPEVALTNIASFFGSMRSSLLHDGTAIARVKSGKIPDNPFGKAIDGVRHSQVRKGKVKFEKPLKPDFKLIMKHNGHFSFLLPELMNHYSCFAIIRNPLASLASWQTIAAPVAQGNLKVLRFLDPELYDTLEKEPVILDRQIQLLHALFRQIAHLPSSHIIKYEEIIASQGEILSRITERRFRSSSPLRSRNQNPDYLSFDLKTLARRLISTEGPIWNYYTKKDVLALL